MGFFFNFIYCIIQFMYQKLLTPLLFLLNFISYAQEKTIGEYSFQNFNYKVVERITDDSKKMNYEIQRVINDSVISKIEQIKYYKTTQEEYNSTYKLIDGIFTFMITLNKDNQTMYGVNRFFIGEYGKLFPGTENEIFTTIKPIENNYNAQFKGGIEKLRRWIQYNFEAERLIKSIGINGFNIQVKLDIDKEGTPILTEIVGNDNPKIRTEVERIIRRMPKWIPAKQNNENVVSKFSIPINIIGIE